VKDSRKLIINAAITGGVLNKSDNPHLPVDMDEIVACSRLVRDAGAAIVHLHARNPDQSPCYDPQVYTELVRRVRQATDLMVCVSMTGRFVADPLVRAAGLAAQPDLASLTVGSMNFMTQASVNTPDTIRFLAEKIYAAGAVPEIEAFEVGFIHFANYLIRKGVLRPPHYFNLILGSLGSAPLDPIGLGHMVSMLPQGAIWSVGGLGQYQLDANAMAIASGGHVRVGLEDNIYYDRDRTDLADNVGLVARIARIARELGRPPATPAEARQIMGMPPIAGMVQNRESKTPCGY
jgi:3-keto-5-aminohexanoate cleavage enzyme